MGGIIQPGRGGGIQGRGVSARCGQGSRRSFYARSGPAAGSLDRFPSFTPTRFTGSFTVSGIAKDSTGTPLAGAVVDLFSESRVWLGQTTSDGTGAYAFTNVGVGSVFIRAYKEGSPEVAGTTIHNVQPIPG